MKFSAQATRVVGNAELDLDGETYQFSFIATRRTGDYGVVSVKVELHNESARSGRDWYPTMMNVSVAEQAIAQVKLWAAKHIT